MQKYNDKKFRDLLVAAIGASSKQDFAKRAGMVPQQLSRYLREDYKARPSQNTLKKIADAANDPELYETLLKVCGYEETPSMIRKSKPFEDRARLNAIDLKNGLSELTKCTGIYSSIDEIVDAYGLIYSSEDITEFRVFARREFVSAKWPAAEQSACVDIKFESAIRECVTRFVLYYAETRGGNIVAVGSATDPKAIYEAGGMNDDLYQEFKDKDFVYRAAYKKGINTKEALFNAIFGDMGEEYPYTDIGFGFYLPSVPAGFREFLAAHKESFCTGQEEAAAYNEIISGSDPAKVLADYSGSEGLGKGFQAAVAKIMKEETDLPFVYFDPDEDSFPDNVPCVMLPDSVDGLGGIAEEYNLEDLKEICNGYAAELGIETYGEVHLQTKRQTNNKCVFKTK